MNKERIPLQTPHTPGPWAIGYSLPGSPESTLAIFTKSSLDEAERSGGPADIICKVSPSDLITDTDRANAQVMMAAPDLLEACREWMFRICDDSDLSEIVHANHSMPFNRMCAAINLATTIPTPEPADDPEINFDERAQEARHEPDPDSIRGPFWHRPSDEY